MTLCIMQSRVDAHFAGTIAPEDERGLRAHLDDCARCTDRYRRRLVLASLDPEALAPVDRIGKGLGLERASSREASRPGGAFAKLAFAAAAAAALALWIAARSAPHEELAARGGVAPAPASHVEILHARPGAAPSPLVGAMRRDDELAFAAVNGANKAQLMIFAVDEHGHVFWYHPSWTNAADDPASVPLPSSMERVELREAIAHDLDGPSLEVHALFLESPTTVRAVEAKLGGRGAPIGPLSIDGAIDHVVTLEVLP